VIDLVEGVNAFARDDFAEVVRRIGPVLDQIVRIGGSHAQRDALEETLLVACLRAGHFEQAEVLLRTRLERRPSARDLFWLSHAQSGLGLQPAAAESLRESLQHWPNADSDAPELAALTTRGVP
jgi:uncharacterized protein HemY